MLAQRLIPFRIYTANITPISRDSGNDGKAENKKRSTRAVLLKKITHSEVERRSEKVIRRKDGRGEGRREEKRRQ